MNPKIASLALQPRGKPFRSRLIPYDADIWAWLASGETYHQIALYLRERGLCVSHAAVHNYVSVRIRRRQSLNYLPGPSPSSVDEALPKLKEPSPILLPPEPLTVTTNENIPPQKEYVFTARPSAQIQLQDTELALNDPTAI